jgi:predicted ABC-type ATPase
VGQKKLRIFAGPNGSGKSTLVNFIIDNYNINYGYFVNADTIEKNIKTDGLFDFNETGINADYVEFIDFVKLSDYNQKVDMVNLFEKTIFKNNILYFNDKDLTSYHAALLADYIRSKFLASNKTFTFETVMSDTRKLDFIKKAKALGFRIYFYFVATQDYRINIERVKSRVLQGGHSVPDDKIKERYFRTLDILLDAVRLSDSAFLFDNSTENLLWIAEVSNGNTVHIKVDNDDVPDWFIQYIEKKL